MAQAKITEIRELSTEELQGRLRDLKQEGLNLRLQQATGQLENSARIKVVRKEIARAKTEMRAREIAAAEALAAQGDA